MTIACFEFSDVIMPITLRQLRHDLGLFKEPIVVFQVTSLTAYQSDVGQAQTRKLRNAGYGLITVDETSLQTTLQFAAVPLSQHLSEVELEVMLRRLRPIDKREIRAAYDVYIADPVQGLQKASQRVELLVIKLRQKAIKAKLLFAPQKEAHELRAANVVDELYQCVKLAAARGSLGGARSFLKKFRNLSSHHAANAVKERQRLASCKTGFMQACALVVDLISEASAIGIRL